MRRIIWGTVVIVALAAACQPESEPGVVASETTPPSVSPAAPEILDSPTPTPSPTNRWVTERPPWLGERILPLRSDGFGEVQPTPRILRDRRFATIDFLEPPTARGFKFSIEPVPASVVKRSSWTPDCPVTLDQLAYVRFPFWGFDRERHTGELVVNMSVAKSVVAVFRTLHVARFPIEEIRVVTRKEMESWSTAPTGDMNVTSSFECRDAAESDSWSQHAYGLAIDINPFHNPYWRGDLVAPELASAYLDRDWDRPGMIFEGDEVTQAFDSIGWGWGGRWSSLKDWMHFSQNGR